MMPCGKSRHFDVVRTILGILLVPALWPLSFIGVAICFPRAIDPLLAGLQYDLYFPAFVWLLIILGVTLGSATIFKLKRTNILFIVSGIACAVAVSLALGSFSAWGEYRMIGQPGVVYPDHFDIKSQIERIATLLAFSTAVTVVTTCAFVSVGAFRLFK